MNGCSTKRSMTWICWTPYFQSEWYFTFYHTFVDDIIALWSASWWLNVNRCDNKTIEWQRCKHEWLFNPTINDMNFLNTCPFKVNDISLFYHTFVHEIIHFGGSSRWLNVNRCDNKWMERQSCKHEWFFNPTSTINDMSLLNTFLPKWMIFHFLSHFFWWDNSFWRLLLMIKCE